MRRVKGYMYQIIMVFGLIPKFREAKILRTAHIFAAQIS